MPVDLRADGDDWRVDHESLPAPRHYDSFGAAHRVASNLAADHGEEIAVEHPRNPDLRRMTA